MTKFIIEHLEPELFKWCLIEYKHISKIVGNKNLIITNLQKKDLKKLSKFAEVHTESAQKLNLKNICILDPDAPKTLSPKDKFDYLIFGGILGDYPPRKRTKQELTIKGERRNLQKNQFPTDNAVCVAKMITEGNPISKIPFADNIDLKMGPNESVEFPFRYVLIKKKPLISKELVKLLKSGKQF